MRVRDEYKAPRSDFFSVAEGMSSWVFDDRVEPKLFKVASNATLRDAVNKLLSRRSAKVKFQSAERNWLWLELLFHAMESFCCAVLTGTDLDNIAESATLRVISTDSTDTRDLSPRSLDNQSSELRIVD